MKNAPCQPRGTAEGQPSRPKAVPKLSAEVLIERLWLLYRHLADLRCEHLTELAKLCHIPYETLRSWEKDTKQRLCGVNEEKLARGLGGTSAIFRHVIEKTAKEQDWLKCCAGWWQKYLRLFLSWLSVEAAKMTLLVSVAV